MIAKLYFSALKSCLISSEDSPLALSAIDYDCVVLGSSSGGLVNVPQAATLDARVAMVESHKLGGTCMNVERVPKKVMLEHSCPL